MAIYTKTGDKGETKVFDKKSGELTPVRKDSCHIKTIGAIDELNSYLGVAKAFAEDENLKPVLEKIQENLFIINSILAGGKIEFGNTETKQLERQIDEWEGSLPVLKNFIFYGGEKVASLIFYARALTRKAERELVEFSKEQEFPEEVRKYINRLSDYLFMLARNINIRSGAGEDFWITKK
jgi:cob(I)alamin adenosyltransferase